MVKQRIEERIAGNIHKTINQFNDVKIELINFNTLFDLHKNQIPGGVDYTIFFSLNSLNLCHNISSLLTRPIPSEPLGTSKTQRIAAEIEAQSTYNVADGYAAELSFYVQTSTSSQSKYSSALLYNIGSTSYLPLIIPYLSTQTPLTTNHDLIIACSVDMNLPSSDTDKIQILGNYDGYISYTFEGGSQNLTFVD